MLLVKWTNLLLTIHHYQATGIQGTGSDIIGKITSYQPFDEQCKGNRVCKHWMQSIQQMREYGDAEQVDRIIQILQTVDRSRLNESVLQINNFIRDIQSKSVLNGSLPTTFYQSIPKMVSIIQSIRTPGIQVHMLTALNLNIPNCEILNGGECVWKTQVKTLLGVSRVLLLHYFFPKGEDEAAEPSKELLAMSWFCYNIFMHRLCYDDVWIKKDKESRYSDLVIALNKKMMKEMERRIFGKIEAFDLDKLLSEASIERKESPHKIKFIATEIGVEIMIDFYNSDIVKETLVELILEKQKEYDFQLLVSPNRSLQLGTRS